MTLHRGLLKREAVPAKLARLRAAGHDMSEAPCALCGSLVVFSPGERLEGTTLVCPRCCDDTLTANARQQQPVAIGFPRGHSGAVVVTHEALCPAPRGGLCRCEPDVTVLVALTEAPDVS
jgi:hypothetical protein